jgi:hypothetical protein
VQLVMARSLGKRDINELINTFFSPRRWLSSTLFLILNEKFRLQRGIIATQRVPRTNSKNAEKVLRRGFVTKRLSTQKIPYKAERN